MSQFDIRVMGEDELRSSLSHLPAEAEKAVKKGLRQVGKNIAHVIQAHIQSQGLVDTGQMLNDVTVRLSKMSVVIKETAKRDGYPYPFLYEYVRGRPFMAPAFEQAKAPAVEEMARALDEALRAVDLG